MDPNLSELIGELRTLVAGRHGGGDQEALGMLAARTLELAEVVQEQGREIEELTQRLDLRSK